MRVIRAITTQVEQAHRDQCRQAVHRLSIKDDLRFMAWLLHHPNPLVRYETDSRGYRSPFLQEEVRISTVIDTLRHSGQPDLAHEVQEQLNQYMQQLRLAFAYAPHPTVNVRRLSWAELRQNALVEQLNHLKQGSFRVESLLFRYPLLCITQQTLQNATSVINQRFPPQESFLVALRQWSQRCDIAWNTLQGRVLHCNAVQKALQDRHKELRQLQTALSAINQLRAQVQEAMDQEYRTRVMLQRTARESMLKALVEAQEDGSLREWCDELGQPTLKRVALKTLPYPGREQEIRQAYQQCLPQDCSVIPRRAYRSMFQLSQTYQDVCRVLHLGRPHPHSHHRAGDGDGDGDGEWWHLPLPETTEIALPDADEKQKANETIPSTATATATAAQLVDEDDLIEERVQDMVLMELSKVVKRHAPADVSFDTIITHMQSLHRQVSTSRVEPISRHTPFFVWCRACEQNLERMAQQARERCQHVEEHLEVLRTDHQTANSQLKDFIVRSVRAAVRSLRCETSTFLPSSATLDILLREATELGITVSRNEFTWAGTRRRRDQAQAKAKTAGKGNEPLATPLGKMMLLLATPLPEATP
jgi:hypothetical protein